MIILMRNIWMLMVHQTMMMMIRKRKKKKAKEPVEENDDWVKEANRIKQLAGIKTIEEARR